MTLTFTTDRVADVTAIIRRYRLRPDDEGFAGELRRLYENPGIRACYFRRDGLTVDSMCEAIWDAGLTADRPDCVSFLQWFDSVCTASLTAKRDGASNRPDWGGAERLLVKARTNRHRLYRCPECAQQVRGNRDTAILCGRCKDDAGFPVAMIRAELLPEEIDSTTASATATPF